MQKKSQPGGAYIKGNYINRLLPALLSLTILMVLFIKTLLSLHIPSPCQLHIRVCRPLGTIAWKEWREQQNLGCLAMSLSLYSKTLNWKNKSCHRVIEENRLGKERMTKSLVWWNQPPPALF